MGTRYDLEFELLEEPLALATLVSFFETGLDLHLHTLLLFGILQAFLVEVSLVKRNVDNVSGWHDMVVVDHLKEWLYLRSQIDPLLGHFLGNLLWVPFNTSNQGMRETLIITAFLARLDDDGLPASKSARKDQHHLPSLVIFFGYLSIPATR